MKGLGLTMFQMETTEPTETNTKVYYKHVSGYVIATITTTTVERQTVYWAAALKWGTHLCGHTNGLLWFPQSQSIWLMLLKACVCVFAISIRLSSTNGPNKDDNGVVFADKHSTKYFTVNCLSFCRSFL